MKVTDIKSFIIHSIRDNWVIVQVFTDEGIYGVGDCSIEGRENAVVAAVEALREYLTGKDPFETEKHYYKMFRDAYWAGGAILCGALSAVDGALWDIKGKALNVPVYKLLGGKICDKIRLYANRWFFGGDTPEKLAELAAQTIDKGYTALKWDPFGTAEMEITIAQLHSALKQIKAVREAVGYDVEILIEGHGRFNTASAIRIAHEMSEFKPMFFEEPVMPENIDSLAEVRSKINIPIAAGERYYTLFDFKDALDKKAVDFLQPDLRVAGGITVVKKIAALAESCFVQIAPHNIHSQVGMAMSLHVLASIPNASFLEYTVEEIPWKREIFSPLIVADGGYVKVPEGPGLGIGFNPENALKYPFKPVSMIQSMFEA